MLLKKAKQNSVYKQIAFRFVMKHKSIKQEKTPYLRFISISIQLTTVHKKSPKLSERLLMQLMSTVHFCFRTFSVVNY